MTFEKQQEDREYTMRYQLPTLIGPVAILDRQLRSDFCRSVTRYLAGPVVLLLCVSLLAGCGGQPKKEEPIELQMQIVVTDTINPDLTGRPSPVVLAIYQLAAAEEFEGGDFFAVYDPEGAALGDELLSREQMVLQPGETREYTAKFDPATIFIGVVAAFRDIDASTWRQVMPLPKKSLTQKINIFSKNRLRITIDALAVTIGTGDDD